MTAELRKRILNMHSVFSMAASEIDRELGLPRGTAKRVIVEYMREVS